MTFGQFLRRLRLDRTMTLRQLGEAAGQDYVTVNKVELGLRTPPPLDGIIALADALDRVKELTAKEFETLLDLAAEANGKAAARFTSEQVKRLKASQTAVTFFTRRSRGREGPR